jgi:hypothetical protein
MSLSMREDTKRAHHCTWCGLPGTTVTNRDVADELHHWHRRCWHAQCAWLRGHNPPSRLGAGWDNPRGPIKYRGRAS